MVEFLLTLAGLAYAAPVVLGVVLLAVFFAWWVWRSFHHPTEHHHEHTYQHHPHRDHTSSP
jgi:ABC-type nickel/cobalt efflux system permease component RcnA